MSLEKYINEEFGFEVRVITTSIGEWLVAHDCVKMLGYDLSGKHVASEYIKKFCDEEDYILVNKNSPLPQGAVEKTHPQDDFDYKELGQRGGYLINESGFYSLVFNSGLPQSKEFKRWVTKVVLPQIRLTGGYIHNTQQFVSHYFPDVTDTQELIEKLEERIKLEDTINRLSIQRANKYLQDRKDSWQVQNEYKAKIDFLEELNEILTRNIRDCGYEFSREVKKQLARGEMLGYITEEENTHE